LRILICHGYLLNGTGSNQYVQSLARALCKMGHHLVLFCQESKPEIDFVSSYLRESAHSAGPELVWKKETPYEGTCMVYKPYIGEILPVFVLDDYPGFTVKEFPQLEESELKNYVQMNKTSLKRLVKQFAPDAIIANHAVMLPYIAGEISEETNIPFIVVIHGSAIEFAVKRDPRYFHYALEGLERARWIVVPSEDSSERLTDLFSSNSDDLQKKVQVIPPGVDTSIFSSSEESIEDGVAKVIDAIKERLRGVRIVDFGKKEKRTEGQELNNVQFAAEIEAINAMHPDWLPDSDCIEKLREISSKKIPYIIFVGKLLETKGIHCVIPALPLIKRNHPALRFVIVGFGPLRGILELMVRAIDAGDIRTLKRLCEFGNERYSGRIEKPFAPILEFLSNFAGEGNLSDYLRLCIEGEISKSVVFTGYLSPEEHCHLLRHAKGFVFPSLAPEAFGMVVAEAMAAGVTPITAKHSGIRDALKPLEEVWGDEAQRLLIGTPEKLITRIAAATKELLDMPEEILKEKRKQLEKAACEYFSWETVAEKICALVENDIEF